MTKMALGRGLNALISDTQTEEPVVASTGNVSDIELTKIKQNKYQPRTNFKDAALQELIASVKEKGILQPIAVRQVDGGYELIAGERRYRAAKAIGLEKIPAVIRNVTDEDSLELSLIENIQRENLNPIEEANAYRRLMAEFGLSQEAVSQKVGKDRATVANSIRLLNLPVDIQSKISSGEISSGHAKVLLGLSSASEQRKFADAIAKEGLSVRNLEKLINSTKNISKAVAINPSSDAHITALEEHIQTVLGTKVNICQGKKGGKIEIEYYTREDLERILEFFGVDGNQ